MAGAAALLGALCAFRVTVGADFMLALAIAKALRGPRHLHANVCCAGGGGGGTSGGYMLQPCRAPA